MQYMYKSGIFLLILSLIHIFLFFKAFASNKGIISEKKHLFASGEKINPNFKDNQNIKEQFLKEYYNLYRGLTQACSLADASLIYSV